MVKPKITNKHLTKRKHLNNISASQRRRKGKLWINFQGYKGIWQWPIHWCTSQWWYTIHMISILWITISGRIRLDNKLSEATNQNSNKSSKLLYIIHFGTSVINSRLSPPSLINLSLGEFPVLLNRHPNSSPPTRTKSFNEINNDIDLYYKQQQQA